MALSKTAMAMKQKMSAVITLRRALEAMEREWQELASADEALGEELVWQLLLEKRHLQRQAAQRGLQNWVLLRRANLNERRFRLMKRRYVDGMPWSKVIALCGHSKQYLMREHNRALEQVATAMEGCR